MARNKNYFQYANLARLSYRCKALLQNCNNQSGQMGLIKNSAAPWTEPSPVLKSLSKTHKSIGNREYALESRPMLSAKAKDIIIPDTPTAPHKGDAASRQSQSQQFPVAETNYEDHLIEMTLGGDESAFEKLVLKHSRRVFSIARHFFRNQETVEDIVQETFAKAFFSLSSYRRGASFEQWLAKIAVNNCYDELRRRKKRNESLITDLSEDEEGWLENKLSHAAFEIHFSEAEREKAAEISDKLLSKLSVDDRMILILLHAENNSVKEISRMMGWSEAKVKIRAFRARHALRKALARLQMSEKRKSMSRG